MPTLELLINGTDRVDLLVRQSLGVTDEIGGRSTCSFTLVDTSETPISVQTGEPVQVTYDGEVLFGGSADRPKRKRLPAGGGTRIDVTCVDHSQIPDRHLVARTFENMTAGDIVRSIVDTELAGEGITVAGASIAASGSEIGATSFIGTAVVGSFTLGGVVDGPIVERAVFNYVPASEALSELAQLVGFHWTIDYDKLLSFAPREQLRAPFDVDATVFTDLDVEETRDQYRNRQFIRAGVDLTDEREEAFLGDGVTQTVVVAFPVAQEPTVEIKIGAGSWTAQTVGIKGVDAEGSADWYWNKGENEVTQDTGGTVLTASDQVRVTYRGSFPILVSTAGDAEIDARAAVEGGTGVYEMIEDDPSLDSVELAQAKSAALLRRFGSIPENIEFGTYSGGLRAGQLVYVESAGHDVAGDYLIESVDVEDVGVGATHALLTTVRATSGERLDNWLDYFRQIRRQGRRYAIRENEQLAAGRSASDVVALTDALVAGEGAVSSTPNLSQVIEAAGPVSFWPMEAEGDTLAKDVVGDGDGAWSGTRVAEASMVSSEPDADAPNLNSSAYATIPHGDERAASEFTFECVLEVATYTANKYVVAGGRQDATAGWSIVRTSGGLEFSSHGSGSNSYGPTAAVSNGIRHVLVSIDASKYKRVFIDGVLAAGPTLHAQFVPHPTYGFVLGASQAGATPYTDRMQKAAFYDYAITDAADAAARYAQVTSSPDWEDWVAGHDDDGSSWSDTVQSFDPVGWWRTDGDVTDAMGNHDGVPAAGLTFTDGLLLGADPDDQAALITGSYGFRIPSHADFDVTEWTFHTIARVDSGAGTYRGMVEDRGGTFEGWNIYAANTDRWQLWLGAGVGWSIHDLGPVEIGVKEQFVVSHTGSSCNVYRNGELVAGPISHTFLPNNGSMWIGSIEGSSYAFKGAIDEPFFVSGTALSSDDALLLFERAHQAGALVGFAEVA